MSGLQPGAVAGQLSADCHYGRISYAGLGAGLSTAGPDLLLNEYAL
jgi:hypothetical protein